MANKTGDYEADKQRLKEFLANFSVTDEEGKKTFKYAEQLTAIAHREQTSLTIDLEDVAGVDEDLATAIRENTRRYNLIVAEAVEDLLPEYRTRDVPSRDALDVFIKHRQTATERAQATVAPGVQQPPAKVFPPELMRRFEVYFKTQASDKVLPIREVKAGQIGKLISIKGIVTRATEVKPMMQVATYTCDQCGAETFQPINSTSFMPQVKWNKILRYFLLNSNVVLLYNTDHVPWRRLPCEQERRSFNPAIARLQVLKVPRAEGSGAQ